MAEEDELTGISHGIDQADEPTDNSLGRLLTLSDGVFAIAMTLLALDLKVPDLGSHPGDPALRHALAANADSYWSYLLTFYVVSRYWGRHRRLMRSVVVVHPALIRDTLVLLVLIAAMPFPASLLGSYGGEPIALAIYGAVNALATLVLLLMSWDVRRLGLSRTRPEPRQEHTNWLSWLNLVVFLLCLPAGYLVGSRGAFVLLLLAVPTRATQLAGLLRRVDSAATGRRPRDRSDRPG